MDQCDYNYFVAQSTFSAISGQDLSLSSFAAAVLTSGAMSGMDATIGGFKQFANTWGGSMATGFVMGGIGAGITGGDIWQGAAVGCVVALANFSLHKVVDNSQFRKGVDSAGKKNGFDPRKPAIKSVNTVDMLNRDVEMLSTVNSNAGNPKFNIVETISDNGGVGLGDTHAIRYSDGTVKIDSVDIAYDAFESYYKLAGTLFHEQIHCIDYIFGYSNWINSGYTPEKIRYLLEYRATGIQLKYGAYDPNNNTVQEYHDINAGKLGL